VSGRTCTSNESTEKRSGNWVCRETCRGADVFVSAPKYPELSSAQRSNAMVYRPAIFCRYGLMSPIIRHAVKIKPTSPFPRVSK
jgi:hypothetical protein